MEMNYKLLKFIQTWFQNNCDSEWEHSYGIKIESLDKPGWMVQIDLIGTAMEGLIYNDDVMSNNENDWYNISVMKNQFRGTADPTKLEFILRKFKEFANKHN